MVLLFSILSLFILVLVAETISHNRKLNKIPYRITVSGTRGKTTVVRILASILRQNGNRVLAKSTGSEATYINPDGSIEKIRRRGIVSILEQKRFVKKAVDMDVEFLIGEVMSIHPENHKVESKMLIKPEITVITNFFADHIEHYGEKKADIVESYLNDVCSGAKVFIRKADSLPELTKGIEQKNARSIEVDTESVSDESLSIFTLKYHIDNIRLAEAVARNLGIDSLTIEKGIELTELDIGQPEYYDFEHKQKEVRFVNLFSANDPHSSKVQIKRIIEEGGYLQENIFGILSLRRDRESRSLQWLNYLGEDKNSLFSNIYVCGAHKNILIKRIPVAVKLRSEEPRYITAEVLERANDKSIVFGLANIQGTGYKLIDYWKSEGKSSHLISNNNNTTI